MQGHSHACVSRLHGGRWPRQRVRLAQRPERAPFSCLKAYACCWVYAISQMWTADHAAVAHRGVVR